MKRLIFFVLCTVLFVPSLAVSEELHVYNWWDYLPAGVLRDFTKETGVKVTMSTYACDEAMYAKMCMTDGGGYDIVVPSTDFTARMRKDGLLQPLDKTKLTNLKHLDPGLMNQPFDPDNIYSVPYIWGSTGIAVNVKNSVAAGITSFADLWNPELKGKIFLPDNLRGVLPIGLKRLGYSLNEKDPSKVAAACELLMLLMPSVRVSDPDSFKPALLNNEVSAAVLWNGEAYSAAGENPDIRYIYPQEGFGLWVDNLCIPKNAVNVENAHLFINYLLRPEVSAFICQEMGYSSPNLAARALLPEEVRENEILYPSHEIMARGEFETDLGAAARAHAKCWTRLKIGK